MTRDEITERLNSLEIIVSEQQQTIDDLNDIITKQWRAHELLKHELAKMTNQLQDLAENQTAPANQKAPHY